MLLNVAAALLVGRRLVRNAVSPLDVLTLAALIVLIVGELDLNRSLFGRHVVSATFLQDAATAPPMRLIGVLVSMGVPVVLTGYALTRSSTLVREGREALAAPWGRVLAASAVILAFVGLFESRLERMHWVSRYFLEELLELTAAIGVLVATASRRR